MGFLQGLEGKIMSIKSYRCKLYYNGRIVLEKFVYALDEFSARLMFQDDWTNEHFEMFEQEDCEEALQIDEEN